MPIVWNTNQVAFTVSEPLYTPALGMVLGYGAAVSFIAGTTGAALINSKAIAQLRLNLIVLWGAAILLFLTGSAAGPRLSNSKWRDCGPDRGFDVVLHGRIRFSFALGSCGRTRLESARMLLLLAGYASLIVFDVRAARRLEAPPYFARLRPVEMPG